MKVTDHFLTKEQFELRPTDIPGILKTHPVPHELDRYYQSTEYISHHQDSGGLKQSIYKFLQKINLNYKANLLNSELFRNAKVMDYGCGAGEFLKFIENDYQTFGFEPNPSAREFASRKLSKTVLIDDLKNIENQSLDAITLWHVFEHIENQQDILNHFYTKLKANGLLIIAVPNHTSYDGKKYQSFWAAYDVPRHIYHFSKAGMERLMNNEQWKVKYSKPLLLDSFYISILSEKYRKNPFFWIVGPVFGAISNFKALKSGEFSSVIYVIEKK